MINSIDLTIGTAILLIGMAYWTVSIVEHNNNYVDAVKTDYLFDKGISVMESMVKDGTLQDIVLLYYFNNTEYAKELVKQRIPFKKYKFEIDGNVLIDNLNNPNRTICVIAVLTLNRTEGWYVIYGNSSEIKISNKRFIDWLEAYNRYSSYEIDTPVYLSRNITSSEVKLYLSN